MPTVRWTSNKQRGDNTSRLVLEGTSSDPVREIRLGDVGELSDEELSRHAARRNFTTEDSNDAQPVGEGQQQDQEPQQSGEQAASRSFKKNRKEV